MVALEAPQQALQPSSLPLLQATNKQENVSLERVSLYVGDLDPCVTEADLSQAFFTIGPIVSLRLCRDAVSGKSLRYAYVNFASHSEACKALACLNHAKLKGIPMRIMWCQRDPLARKTGIGNLFVKNLGPSINSVHLETMFCKFGTILSCKVAEENGRSKGFGFVQFNTEESAVAALSALNGTLIEGKKLYVSKFVKKSERTAAHEEPTFKNLYVKNLDEDMTEDILEDKFSQFGKVNNVAIMKDGKGKSRGFAFVSFVLPEDAKKAVGALNGAMLGSKHLFVGRAQKKAEREELLKHAYKEGFNAISNLFVKNLDPAVDDNKLQEHFSTCGQIISARVMRDGNGISKGNGFVSFSNPEEAKKALNTLNGTILEGKSLYVAMALRKENRCSALPSYHPQSSLTSLYPLNGDVLPQFRPFLYQLPPCPPLSHQLSQPILYQDFGTNVGTQYPLTTQSYHDRFSTCVPTRQSQWCNTKDQVYQKHSMLHADTYVSTGDINYKNPGSQKLGSTKYGNKQSGPVKSTYTGSASARGRSLTAATSFGNSKNAMGNLLYSSC